MIMRTLLAAVVLGSLIGPAGWAAERNVVLMVVDDQGLDAGCYGNPVIQTPSLDRLAADGTRFDYAFCTTASCSASRSVILTGMYNHANGQYGHQHSYHHFVSFPNVKSLPVSLSEAGYRTMQIGKYHVAPEEVYRFDHHVQADTRSPVEMAEECREFVAAGDDRPFFLYFCTSDPHRGGGRVEDSPYKPDRFGNRPQGYPGVKTVTYDPKDVIVPPFLPDTPPCRAELAQYCQSVSRVDQGLGRLVQLLKDAGRYEETLVIYISDNGIAFPGAKTTTYEPGLRLPCVVRNPYNEKRGIATDAMVTWADLAPTILDFAGCLPKKSPIQGRSFLSVLDREKPDGWDEIYASHTFHEITMYYPMRVVRGRRYKLIWNLAHELPYPFASDLWASSTFQDRYRHGPATLYGKRAIGAYIHRPRFELYDLEKDPDEVHNLADDPAHAEILEAHQAKLKEFQKRTRDPWILKWEYE
ncbi:MAG TPA: sulfatase [Thermoguttaceae bacterium]|nr:sulfatase [Thermoguttaceae bacterium]